MVALEMVPPDISFEFYRKPSIEADRNELPPGDWRADSLKRCMAARSLRTVIAMIPVWSGMRRSQVRGCVARGTELDSKDSMKDRCRFSSSRRRMVGNGPRLPFSA
jgi:hypothetical protein